MDIKKAKALMGDLKSLETSSGGRLKEGTAIVLINKVENFMTRDKKQMIRVKTTVLKPLTGVGGKRPEEDGYEGHVKGDSADYVFGYGDYLARDLGDLVCAATGLEKTAVKEISGAELLELLASVVTEEGEAKPGAFDNTAIIELKGRASSPKKDDTKPGKLQLPFINGYPLRNVKPSEIADSLTEKDVERYFGSTEAFMKLVENEG
jgi:hypothetical protein